MEIKVSFFDSVYQTFVHVEMVLIKLLMKNVLLLLSKLKSFFPLYLEQLGWNSGSSFVLNTE